MNQALLKQAFSKWIGIDLAEDHGELAYNTHPKWDSTAHMILVTEIEQAFNIMLDMDDIIALSSFEKAREIVEKYV
jgi:acyl carrier protein